MVSSERIKWFALALILAVQFMVGARRRDRERRAALHPDRSPLLAGEPAVGDQRLRARVRRVPAPRRAPRRPARAQARLHGRTRHLHARLAAVRPRVERDVADRVPRAPGPRRGDDHAGGALDPRRDFQRGSRAQHRPRRLGRRRRLRRRSRRPVRRDPHRFPLVAVDLLRQRPGRESLALVLAPFLLSESLDNHGQGFDIPGAVLVTSGLSMLVLGITQGHSWGWALGEDDRRLRRVRRLLLGVRGVGGACRASARAASRSSGFRR